jgi:hypothetical protein
MPTPLLASTALQGSAFRLTSEEGSLVVDCCESGTTTHRVSLYAPEDRTDARDLLGDGPSIFASVRAARLAGRMGEERARLAAGVVCREETLVAADEHFEQLRALGYLGD